MTKRTTLALLAMLVVCLVISDSCPGAPPTIGDLAGLPTSGSLGPAGKNMIDDYVKYWVGVLCETGGQKVIQDAAGKLRAGYRANPSVVYQIEYARSVSVHAPSALTLKKTDPLRRVKEISIAIAVAGMDQYTIQEALVIMAGHRNPGVRYWAAKGYRTVGRKLLQMGGAHARRMATTLSNVGVTEPSAPVVTELIGALRPHPGVPRSGARACAAALAKVWLVRCLQVRDGKAGMADALRRCLWVTRRVRQEDPTTRQVRPQDRKASLQMLRDLMEGASRAFAAGKGDEKSQQVKDLKVLLTAVEAESAAALGANERPIAVVLGGKEPLLERRIQVRMKVNNFWRDKFKAEGVTTQVKPATTRPAPGN